MEHWRFCDGVTVALSEEDKMLSCIVVCIVEQYSRSSDIGLTFYSTTDTETITGVGERFDSKRLERT
jgi:hypothetical protein